MMETGNGNRMGRVRGSETVMVPQKEIGEHILMGKGECKIEVESHPHPIETVALGEQENVKEISSMLHKFDS